MRKHKVMCEEFGNASSEIVTSEAYYETADQSEADHSLDDNVEYEDDTLLEHIEEPSPKRLKKEKKGNANIRGIVQRALGGGGTPKGDYASPRSSQPASPFAHAVRVWERKLNDLPLAQALQIEKYVNDMLYDASLANVTQATSQQPIIKVNITTPSMDQHLE